jgi:GTPase SAR1 family protein
MTVAEDQTHTIGVEFGAKIVEAAGKKIKLQIWDTVRNILHTKLTTKRQDKNDIDQ